MSQYRVPVYEFFPWQAAVKDILNDPPVTPLKGDRYIVGTSPTGAWGTASAANKIAYCSNATGPVWSYDTPTEGFIAWVNDVDQYWKFNGTWTEYLGQQGPQGNQGNQGTQGDQGDQGDQGAKGDQGDQGDQGAKGDQGDQGDQGDKGDQGDQGNQGNQGDQGPQGPQGPQADYDADYKCLMIEAV